MSRKVAVPTEQQARQALAELTAETESAGRRPTVIGLARRLGMANPTFWRHFPDIAEEVRATARAQTPGPGAPGAGPCRELEKKNAALRRANADLTEHLDLAVANIQRLALENHQLRGELEAATKVTPLPTPRSPS